MNRERFDGSSAILELVRQQELVRDMIDPPGLRAIREADERVRNMMDPPGLRAIREADERVRNMMDPPGLRAIREADERIRDLVDPPGMRAMREAMDAIQTCSTSTMASLLAHDGLAALRSMPPGFDSLTASSWASMTTFARSSQIFGLGATVVEAALRKGRLEKYADRTFLAVAGITKLAARISEPNFQLSRELVAAGVHFMTPAFGDGAAELIAEMPSEVFRALDLDVALPSGVEGPVEDERLALSTTTADELEANLADVNPQLLALLKGARHAARSANPDKARHVCVSFRELLGHVLHQLAPDAQVKDWTSDPKDFHEGRPTRKARIAYLYSAAEEPALRKFIAADIRAALELFDALSRGTHVANLDASAAGLAILQNRSEGILLLLLRLGCRHRGA